MHRRASLIHRVLAVLLGAALAAPGLVRASSPSNVDDQLWNETRLVYKLNPQVNLFTSGAFRLVNDFGELGRVSGRWGLGWQPLPNLTVMPSFLYTAFDPAGDNSNAESRLCLLTSYRIPIKTAMLTLINTTEYRMPETTSAAWWLRPQLQLAHPVGPKSFGLDAYVADEVFYSNGRNTWTANRLFAGLRKNVNENTDVELYYCRQFNLSGTNPDINVIGISVRFTLGPRALPTPDEPDLQ